MLLFVSRSLWSGNP